jgi:hypothetical protein
LFRQARYGGRRRGKYFLISSADFSVKGLAPPGGLIFHAKKAYNHRMTRVTKKYPVLFLAPLFLSILDASSVQAQTMVYDGPRFSVGLGSWLGSGKTSWNHNVQAASAVAGNPSSKLEYEDLDSSAVEVKVEVKMPSWYFMRGEAGFGGIGGGELIDSDFLKGDDGDFLASQSSSKVESDKLWYLNIDVGRTLLSSGKSGKNSLRGFVGYQHWEESYDATGINYQTCTVGGFILGFCQPAGTSLLEGSKVISNTAKWDSIRIGLDGAMGFTEKLGMEARAVFIPYADMHNEDTHHLRDDLSKPAFVMNGYGIGYNMEADLRYALLKNFYFTAGYRYWKLESDGDVDIRAPSGDSTFPLNELSSERHGFILGLTYKF